ADFTMQTMPARFAAIGDRHHDIDRHPCSLGGLLELSARHKTEGLGDAPWPPQYKKKPDEPTRVQPSRRAKPKDAAASSAKTKTGTGRRVSKLPLIEIGRAEKKAE